MKREIIIVHKSPWQSMVRTATSTAATVLVIGIGWLLGSSAMQWAGFLFLLLIGIGTGMTSTMTVAEARARLDEIEREISAATQRGEQ